MPGHDFGAAGNLVEEVEHETLVRVVSAVRQPDPEPDQRVEQPVLGDFQLRPPLPRAGGGKVRDDAIVPASNAHLFRALGIDQPIADAMRIVGAEAATHARLRDCLEEAAIRLQR